MNQPTSLRPPPTILITGVSSLRNRGVEALVRPTIEQLCQRVPDLKFITLSGAPDHDQLRLGDSCLTVLPDHFRAVQASRWQRLLARSSHLVPSLSPGYQALIQQIRRMSLVIATGGDIFSSDYGSFRTHLQPLQVATDAGVPFVLLAQSVGPFKTEAEARAWLQVARHARLITVREQISACYLTDSLGLPARSVHLTADPAFLLVATPVAHVDRMRQFYGLVPNEPVIAVAVSQGISRYGSQDARRHFETWRHVLHQLTSRLSAQVLLIPHVQETSSREDDRLLATELVRALQFSARVRLAGADHTAAEFKGLVSSCDLVIAERMHVAIAGLSSGICTIAVGYSVKSRGIISDLMGAELTDSSLVLPLQKFLEPPTAWEFIHNAWRSRAMIQSRLQRALPAARERALANFDLVAKVLTDRT